MKIPLEIQEIRDPDGASRFKAIVSFQDAIAHTSHGQKLIQIQNEYTKFVDNCQRFLKEIRSNRKHMADSHLQWNLANEIYSFIRRIEDYGHIFANISEALPRDLGISKSQLNYLMKFRTYYPSINHVLKEINWSKYRELMDFPDEKSRKECEALIKIGKITTDTEIRAFKRKIKARKTI
jgi:hypothetical protein